MTATLTAPPTLPLLGAPCDAHCPTSAPGVGCDGVDTHDERDGIVWHTHHTGAPGRPGFLTAWTDQGDTYVLAGPDAAVWMPPTAAALQARRDRQAAFGRGDHLPTYRPRITTSDRFGYVDGELTVTREDVR